MIRLLFFILPLFTGNFPRDLYGPLDTRSATWGHADYADLDIPFYPPTGMRVRVLRIRGDLLSWPKVMENEPAVPPNRYAGVLVGFSTSDYTGEKYCQWCAANTLVYRQDGIHGGEVRDTVFDWDMDVILPADNTITLRIASYLNTTGYPIHMEATWQAKVEWVQP